MHSYNDAEDSSLRTEALTLSVSVKAGNLRITTYALRSPGIACLPVGGLQSYASPDASGSETPSHDAFVDARQTIG